MDLSLRTAIAIPALEGMADEIPRSIHAYIAALPEDEAARLAELNPVSGD